MVKYITNYKSRGKVLHGLHLYKGEKYMNMNERNKEALTAVSYYTGIQRAQYLFTQNAEDNPCFKTYFNLGIFHIFENYEKYIHFYKKKGTYNAGETGMKYLRQAEMYKNDEDYDVGAIYNAMATIYFMKKDYKNAKTYFEKAIDKESTFEREYNLGVTCFRRQEYREAAASFKKFYCLLKKEFPKTVPYTMRDTDDFYIEYLYAVQQYDNKEAYKEVLLFQEKEYSVFGKFDIFLLAYLCGDYKITLQIHDEISDQLGTRISDAAIVFECCFKIGDEKKAKKILYDEINFYNSFEYNVFPNIQKIKKAYRNERYRKKKLKESFIPPQLWLDIEYMK